MTNDSPEIAGTQKESLAAKASFIGGGAGLGLFAVFGVLNASFIGGIIGINIAGAIMGLPLESNLISRAIVAIGMLIGIMVAGLMFIAAGATVGWMAGKLIDRIRCAIKKSRDKEHLKGIC